MGPIGRSVLAIALPLTVFFAGVWFLQAASGASASRTLSSDSRPLNQRYWGYNAAAVEEYWKLFDDAGRQVERRLLELDLVFPFAYGGALAAGLLIAWAGLGRGFNPAWLLGLVGLGVLADWTENLVQLAQLDRFSPEGVSRLQPAWIAVASVATQVKLASLALGFLTLVVLAGAMLFRRS